jgi:hypothetical protein
VRHSYTTLALVVAAALVAAACGASTTYSPVGSPPGNQPPAANPPGNQPPAANPPGNQPPAANPPGNQPPAANPPGNQPPAASGDADTWRAQIQPGLWQLGPGVGIGTTGDNRVVVVVPDEAKAQQVRQLAASKGVPAAGLVVYVGQFRRDAHLRDQVRPVVAGLQIQRPDGASCTIGALARRLDTGEEGFLTASHCSNQIFSQEGTPFGQPTNAAADQVAVESADPPLGACPAGFPAGAQCRNSDISFARWNTGFTQFNRGRIAYQGGVLNNPFATIVGNSTVVGRAMSPADIPLGAYLWKVGRTTGTTLVGFVMSTNFIFREGNTFQINQILTYKLPGSLGTDRGDSGSGLYIVSPSHTSVRLVAIHSASLPASSAHTLGVHSPVYGFEDDLGVPRGTFQLTP